MANMRVFRFCRDALVPLMESGYGLIQGHPGWADPATRLVRWIQASNPHMTAPFQERILRSAFMEIRVVPPMALV